MEEFKASLQDSKRQWGSQTLGESWKQEISWKTQTAPKQQKDKCAVL